MIEIIFLLIPFLVGFLARRFYAQADKAKLLVNNYLIYFGLPFFIFAALLAAKEIPLGELALYSFLAVLAGIVLVYLLSRQCCTTGQRKAAFFLTGSMGNTGYLGIPISFLFFGTVGAGVAAIFSTVLGILHYTLGVFISDSFVEGTTASFKEMLKFPLLWGLLAAIFLSRFDLVLPEMVNLFASTAIYLALFVIGVETRFTKFDPQFLQAGAMKFLVVPLAALAVVFFSPLPDLYKIIIVLQSLMPPALANTNIAVKFGFDSQFTAEFTSFVTVLFLAIVFVVSLFL